MAAGAGKHGTYNYEYDCFYEHKRYGSRDGLPGKSLEWE